MGLGAVVIARMLGFMIIRVGSRFKVQGSRLEVGDAERMTNEKAQMTKELPRPNDKSAVRDVAVSMLRSGCIVWHW